jgi:hypothetical protein
MARQRDDAALDGDADADGVEFGLEIELVEYGIADHFVRAVEYYG